MFRGSVKGTGYPLHSPVSLSLPLPCDAVCHHISTELYHDVGVREEIERGLGVGEEVKGDIELEEVKK